MTHEQVIEALKETHNRVVILEHQMATLLREFQPPINDMIREPYPVIPGWLFEHGCCPLGDGCDDV